jgi:hypothetical protein
LYHNVSRMLGEGEIHDLDALQISQRLSRQ